MKVPWETIVFDEIDILLYVYALAVNHTLSLPDLLLSGQVTILGQSLRTYLNKPQNFSVTLFCPKLPTSSIDITVLPTDLNMLSKKPYRNRSIRLRNTIRDKH